jgi:hypothetical protein
MGNAVAMRTLVNPLAMTRLAVQGITGAARLGGAGVLGASALAGRIIYEAIERLRAPSARDHRHDGSAGASERGVMEQPVDGPPEPRRGQRTSPRRKRASGHVSHVARDVRSPGDAEGAASRARAIETVASRPAGTRPRRPAAHRSDSRDGAQRSHVSEAPRLVRESADPGAEDGAGAHVQVEQPWSGYASLKAAEVVDRLVAEPEAVLSLVLLYERAHRARRSVLEAAERQLRRSSSQRTRQG